MLWQRPPWQHILEINECAYILWVWGHRFHVTEFKVIALHVPDMDTHGEAIFAGIVILRCWSYCFIHEYNVSEDSGLPPVVIFSRLSVACIS